MNQFGPENSKHALILWVERQQKADIGRRAVSTICIILPSELERPNKKFTGSGSSWHR